MKRWHGAIIVIIGLLGLGAVYTFCIPCQFFGWMPLPSAVEMLANSQDKPIHLVDVWVADFLDDTLCVSVSKAAFVKASGHSHGMLFDMPNQILAINDSFEKSFKFFVDNWQKPLGDVAWSDVGPFMKCVDIEGAYHGQHVANIQYVDLDRIRYSYTWVFEVTADGIVPEVTAITPS